MIVNCVSALRNLENAEYRIGKKREDVLLEMGRIAARQFSWQRGFTNTSTLYRNAFVYGQGKCSNYFESRYGISLNRFSQIGFMLYVSFTNAPEITTDSILKHMKVEREEVERVLDLISLPFNIASREAKVLRQGIIHTQDKPSVLRQRPCLRFGDNGQRIRAPIPELVMERITSGVYYDLVGGDGAVRNDYAAHFELYCYNYFSAIFKTFHWERELSYFIKKNENRSPDIIASRNERVLLAVECKATRMTHEAAFGIDPSKARGYEDLTKAVYQLWRFFSHCRRGIIPRSLSEKAFGIVLTLDNWLVMSEALRTKVLLDAAILASENDPAINDEDRKHVVFVAVHEMEKILSTANEETFMAAMEASQQDYYKFWRLDTIHSSLTEKKLVEPRGYLYRDMIGQILPWWNDFCTYEDDDS